MKLLTKTSRYERPDSPTKKENQVYKKLQDCDARTIIAQTGFFGRFSNPARYRDNLRTDLRKP